MLYTGIRDVLTATTLRNAVKLFLLLLFVTLYIYILHLTAMYSSTFGKGWVGRSCLYFLICVSFGSFSLRELTCMHMCVSGAVNTQGFVWTFFMRYI